MLPTSTEDDKHAKYRRRLCWRGSRWFTSTVGRTFLLFLLPITVTVSRLWFRDKGSMLSQRVIAFWWTIAALGWLLERFRVRLIRRRIVTRIPFASLLFVTLIAQLVVFVVTFSSDIPALHESIQRERTDQRRMRGSLIEKSETLIEDIPGVVDEDERGVERETLSWDEVASPAIVDAKSMSMMSPEQIVQSHQTHCSNGVISIILPCHNEHEYATRTLDSLLNSTSPGLLREILIIDDGSSPPMVDSYNTTLFSEPLVRVIRNEEREGLIRSKTLGANLAAGNVIVFLDAHVKPDPGWVFPILRHINTNYKRVVVPKIPVLNGTTWEVNRKAVGEKMMFDWDMSFHWFNNDDDWVPCMSGGLLAMSKKWWHESGELDTGMFVWGGENIEQSVRMWLCGGEIVVAHDSVIAHVFRPKFPYAVNSTKVLYNKLRTVEVWFDEYKDLYYNATGYSAISLKPKVAIPYSGHGTFVDPSVDRDAPYVNISKRVELRERLQCKPFSWYVSKFEDVFRDRSMLAVDSFLIRNPISNRCFRPYSDTVDGAIGLAVCDENDNSQRWNLIFNDTSVQNLKHSSCLDATIGKMPTHWRLAQMYDNTISQISKPLLHHYFETFPCRRSNINQTGWRFENDRLTFGSLCVETDTPLDIVEAGAPLPKAFLTGCTNLSATATHPLPNQHFQIYARKILQPKEVQASRAKR